MVGNHALAISVATQISTPQCTYTLGVRTWCLHRSLFDYRI